VIIVRTGSWVAVRVPPDPALPTTVQALARELAAICEAPAGRVGVDRDRGVEMARHADFTAGTGIPVYFCDAYWPWQRGSQQVA
jgi:IS30 family transposase